MAEEKIEKKQKWKLELHEQCPYCKKPIVIKYKEETITKSVPAEKNEISLVEKDTQTQL